MKDLEIRGAGNLLGGEQSGHIAAVGFDLYVRLVGEAVADFQRRRRRRAAPRSRSSCRSTRTCRTTTSPASGCGSRRTSKLADGDHARTSVDAVRDELVDRYGAAPQPVEQPARGRAVPRDSAAARLTEVTLQGKYVRFAPLELRESQPVRLSGSTRARWSRPATSTVLVPAPTTARIGRPAAARPGAAGLVPGSCSTPL